MDVKSKEKVRVKGEDGKSNPLFTYKELIEVSLIFSML